MLAEGARACHPEAGRANTALETLIARWLGVPPSTVSVAHDGKSRLKQVAVPATRRLCRA